MSLTIKAHKIISEKFLSINYGIDATCGNGNDTLFLAKLCSDNGRIYGFDIQQQALEITSNKLADNNLSDRVTLISAGHETMLEHISHNVEVIIFNLGYLPSSNTNISTEAEKTVRALGVACKLLNNEGLISIVCYPGHEAGMRETQHVKIWIESLDSKWFKVSEYLSEMPDQSTPVLYIIEKI